MTTNSARWGLPFIEAGQAQKEWTHNEALALLDIAVQAAIEGMADVPPASPTVGTCWIVGPVPVGDWFGHVDALAGWTAGGWRFLAPREGMAVWHAGEQTTCRYRAGAWRVDRAGEIAAPAGGLTVDGEARATIAQILAALRTQGLLT